MQSDVSQADHPPVTVPATPGRERRGGWALAAFFAGTTLALFLALALLIWALAITGLSTDLLRRFDPRSTPLAAAATGVDRPSPTPTPTLERPVDAAAAPAPAAPTAAASTRPRTDAAAPMGTIVTSGQWSVVVDSASTENQAEGTRRIRVDLTIRNDRDRANVLEIPSTLESAPRSRLASLRDVQMFDPPALQLRLRDRAGRSYGGGFVGADGDTGGSFTFVAAPGDAIGLSVGFVVPPASADPFVLEGQFGMDAGGVGFSVDLSRKAPAPSRLPPSDLVRINGREERYVVGDLWAFTALALTVGPPAANGERTVTLRVAAENLTDRPLLVGSTPEDGTGSARDFYAVDAEGRLAYSSATSMPRQVIAPGATRTVDVRLQAGRGFSSTGPYRASIVVDPRRDRYAIFRLP